LSACMVRPITLRWGEVATRRRVAHDLRILRSGEKRPQSFANDGVVFGQQNREGLHRIGAAPLASK
jgi:hypothetical protein